MEEITDQGKSLLNVTGDTEGLSEHQKGYTRVTREKLREFSMMCVGTNIDAELESSPPDADLGKSHRKKKKTDEPEEQKDPLSPEVMSKKLKGNIKKTPIPDAGSGRREDIQVLMTQSEAHALEIFRKNVKDLTDREISIFLHGYRLRGDHNVRTMEALLQSLEQCATVFASQGRIIKHTANTLNEGVKATGKISDEKGKGWAKVPKKGSDTIREDVESILSLADTTPEEVFKNMDLSISQIYEALEPVILAIGKSDYSFVEDDEWPGNLHTLLFEKKKAIAGQVGTSNPRINRK